MRTSALRKRITIQQRSTGVDSLNQQLLTWTDLATVFAQVEQLSGRELMSANAEYAENIARITIRFRTDVIEKMRILYGAAIYDITSVSDIDGRRRELELSCKTGLSDG